eukprot:365738-Chlamydomonas_euryale.AAC.28
MPACLSTPGGGARGRAHAREGRATACRLSCCPVCLLMALGASVPRMLVQDKVGSFEVGKEFDALLVDVNVPGGPFDIFDGDSMEDQFEKFINLGDDRNIVEVCGAVCKRRPHASCGSGSPERGAAGGVRICACHYCPPCCTRGMWASLRVLTRARPDSQVYVQGKCVKRGDDFTGDVIKPVPVEPSSEKKRKAAE